MTTLPPSTGSPSPLGIVRCGLTGAIGLAAFFTVCWIGAFVLASQSHMFIEIFTPKPVTSGAALAEGLVWSLAFGALGGALLALIYNALGFVGRR